jgi:hypothetical protein
MKGLMLAKNLSDKVFIVSSRHFIASMLLVPSSRFTVPKAEQIFKLSLGVYMGASYLAIFI